MASFGSLWLSFGSILGPFGSLFVASGTLFCSLLNAFLFHFPPPGILSVHFGVLRYILGATFTSVGVALRAAVDGTYSTNKPLAAVGRLFPTSGALSCKFFGKSSINGQLHLAAGGRMLLLG